MLARIPLDDLSELWLRHVGYSVPTEFWAPFFSAGVEVVQQMTTEDEASDAFRWSLTLISKVLACTCGRLDKCDEGQCDMNHFVAT